MATLGLSGPGDEFELDPPSNPPTVDGPSTGHPNSPVQGRESLLKWLENARELGFLGPRPVRDHVRQAHRFVDALGKDLSGQMIDLGTGAGVPGLMLAWWWPRSTWLLLDGKPSRLRLLEQVIDDLGWTDRVSVLLGRAEVLAHDPALRGSTDLVVARSFGPPAVVAECAAGFLKLQGRLAVSEPPDDGSRRWSAVDLSALGLALGSSEDSIQVIDKVAPTPARFPRRTGIPAKRPLFAGPSSFT